MNTEKAHMMIHLSNVRVDYPGITHKPVLNIPLWKADSGDRIFIYGPSGSGKSTFLNLISGMLSASSGSVCVMDHYLNQMKAKQRDKFRGQNIGYVFQQFNLIPYLDAFDNIRLANQFSSTPKIHNSDITDLLSQLNVPGDNWHTPIKQLSVGQQQRIAIARALINKPKLVIADEPTSSLDPKNRDDFMSLLMSMVSSLNMTLIFVSHDMSLSHYFDRVESLDDISMNEALQHDH